MDVKIIQLGWGHDIKFLVTYYDFEVKNVRILMQEFNIFKWKKIICRGEYITSKMILDGYPMEVSIESNWITIILVWKYIQHISK